MLIAIILGLGAAVAQSLSYIFSRLYVMRHPGAFLRLLVLGHLVMGALSLAMLPLLPLDRLPPVEQYIWPLAGAAGFYLLGQAALFGVLRHVEASRISPLLGLKIAILAVITTVFLHDRAAPTPLQWLAVALSVAAAFALNSSGGRLPARMIGGLLLTCLTYSLSDISITYLVHAVGNGAGGVFMSVALCYLLCGGVALAALPFAGPHQRGDWRLAVPWAVSWLGAMLLLFGCFQVKDVVFGNILQSTRGLISIVLGAGLAGMGMVHLEKKVSRRVFWRHMAAALLMSAAIVLYARGAG
jgi:drug/metabolite transporter (DMT)-like permease